MSDARKHIKQLAHANAVSEVGGKAYGLHKLIQAGFDVPAGFVVTADSFLKMDRELEKTILEHFDDLDCRFAAVRSSAVAEDGAKDAWAGQLSTYLNADRAHVIENIDRCWKSANSERARSYAAQKSISVGAIAVVIQAMIEGEVSGVAFSAHPVTGDKEIIVIEACLGLGEPVVSGSITPDLYVVTKNRTIAEKHIAAQQKKLVRADSEPVVWQEVLAAEGEKQKLSDQQILDLADMVKRIEAFFGYPVDVEWTVKDGIFYLLQSRPITTLPA